MNVSALQHIRKAVQTLNPNTVRELGEKSLKIAIYAASPDDYNQLEDFFVQDLTGARKSEALSCLYRGADPQKALQFDLAIYDESVLAPSRSLVFRHHAPQRLVEQILEQYDHAITLPLAKLYPPFHAAYAEQVINTTSRENALFSMATALPDIIPSLIELPWAITEFASDTAVLTTNQIKMAFLLAAASNREVGYLQQKREIAALIGGAFGLRALARQLVGKIPFGGGLLAKAGVAYAGTKLIGLSLERLYRFGHDYTSEEREQIYKDAFQHGKTVAINLLRKIRPDLAAKHSTADAETAKT
jgi:hypothetical protein